MLLVAAVSIFVTSLLPRTYEASSTIRIDELQHGLQPLEVMERTSTGSDVVTEMEALRSRTLAEAVIDSLGTRVTVTKPRNVRRSSIFTRVQVAPESKEGSYRLVQQRGRSFRLDSGETHMVLGNFEVGRLAQVGGLSFQLDSSARAYREIDFTLSTLADAVDEVQKELVIDRVVRDANVITVRYRSPDPELARDFPNAIVERFMSRRQSVRQRGARSTVAFLREQIDRLAGQLSTAENSLRSFREDQRVVDPEEEGRTQLTRMADVRAQLGQLEAERASLAKLLREVESASRDRGTAGSPYRNLVAFPSLLRNQAASQLLASLSTVEDHRAELLTRRSMQDPDVKQLTTRVGELERQLLALTTTYLDGLTNQIGSLEGTLTRSSEQLDLLPAKEVEFVRRQRETKLLGDLYSLLQTRLKEAEIAAASSDATVQMLDPAALPRRPIAPKPVLNAGLGLLVGLLLGVSAAFARAFIDRSVHSREDLQAIAGVRVLGILPHIRRSRQWFGKRSDDGSVTRLGSGDLPPVESTAASQMPATTIAPQDFIEACNRLEANLVFAGEGRIRTVAVTSPLSGEGKTSVSTNLALISAQRGVRVLLVDADLRRGVLHSLFQSPRAPGLADILDGTASWADSVRSVEVPQGGVLHFLTTGTLPDNPAQLLASTRLRALVQELSTEFDLIILDTPPVNIVADAALISTVAEQVLVVARAGVTTSDALEYAMEQIRIVGVPIVGAVLNDIDASRDKSYGGSHDYYSRSASTDGAERKLERLTN